MPDYMKMLMGHGEGMILQLIEQIERIEGRLSSCGMPLVQRWELLNLPLTEAAQRVRQFPRAI
jgi:hypothetical protein